MMGMQPQGGIGGGQQMPPQMMQMLQGMMPPQPPATQPSQWMAAPGRPGMSGSVMPRANAIPQTAQATGAGIALPPTTGAMNRGGGIAPKHYAQGGELATPWFTKSQAHGESGLIKGYTPGRTDTVNMEPLAGSYVMPADIISGMGEGNTDAGAAVMEKVLSTGPGGIPLPRGQHGSGPPRPPAAPRAPSMESTGGRAEAGADGSRVPIIAANGEYVVSPEQVQALGGGSLKKGHDLLDAFVLEIRKRTIAQLRKLPPPKKK